MQLTHLDQRRATAVLLPLAGGLAVAAVARLSIPAVILPANVVVLVLLGAVLTERPWRTAVLAEARGLRSSGRRLRFALALRSGASGCGSVPTPSCIPRSRARPANRRVPPPACLRHYERRRNKRSGVAHQQ
jgi:hypothetical protein